VIIAEFEQTLAQCATCDREITNQLKRLRKERKADATKLEQLANLEPERRGLGEVGTSRRPRCGPQTRSASTPSAMSR
jgi:hypothetical protein